MPTTNIDVIKERFTVDGVVFDSIFLGMLIEMAKHNCRVDLSLTECGDAIVVDQVLEDCIGDTVEH